METALLIILLYKLLQDHLLKGFHPLLSFSTCLLFIVHPIHTEVIANVKSRDELIAFIFLIATSFSLIRYMEHKNISQLLLGLVYYLLALLTRESAIPYIAIVPMAAYYFYKQPIAKSLLSSIPLVLVFAAYMAIRIAVVGMGHGIDNSILNFPFAFASASEAFATKVFLLAKYISLLVYPFPLSFDYGYNEIPYNSLGSLKFISSALLLFFLLAIAVAGFKKRTILSFSIFFFFVTIFLFSNFIIDIGAPLAERLLFQPSLAFCLAVSYYYLHFNSKVKKLIGIALVAIMVLFSVKTIARNSDWQSNYTLFTTDVESCPKSVRTNLFAGQQCLTLANTEANMTKRLDYYKRTIFYDERILKIYPHYRFIYEDLGYAYYGINDLFKASDFWVMAYKLDTANIKLSAKMILLSDVFYNSGNRKFRQGDLDSAITYYQKAVATNEKNGDAWYNLGGAYFSKGDLKKGMDAWENSYEYTPNHKFNRDLFPQRQ